MKPATLYIQNLNDQVNRDIIKHLLYMLLLTYGDVLDIVVQRGFAHATMTADDAAVAKRCISGELFLSKPLKVEYSTNDCKRVQYL